MQTNVSVGSGYGVTGVSFTKNGIYSDNPTKIEGAQSCRGICFQTIDLPDSRKPISNIRKDDMYPDLVIKDYKMENIDLGSGTFDIKYLIRNTGKVDFKVNDYRYVKLSCKQGNEAGADLNIIHSASKRAYKVDYGVIITKDIPAGSEI
jgi:hypothetical protein